MASKPTKKPAKAKKAVKAKSKGGRPSKYTPELVKAICARLAKGEPMTVICRDEGMPNPSTVWDWEQARPEVSQALARARETGFDAIALDCLDIADNGINDTYERQDGTEAVNTDVIQRSKLRIETRLKLLKCWDPKRYGDKVQLAGHDGGALPAPPAWVIAPVAPRDE